MADVEKAVEADEMAKDVGKVVATMAVDLQNMVTDVDLDVAVAGVVVVVVEDTPRVNSGINLTNITPIVSPTISG